MVTRLGYEQDWMRQYYHLRLGDTPVWRFYDALALSLYPLPTYGRRSGVPEDSIALLQPGQAPAARRAASPASKPIWDTEVNYGLPVRQPGRHQGGQDLGERGRPRTSCVPTCSTPRTA